MKKSNRGVDTEGNQRRLDALHVDMACRARPVRVVIKRVYWHQRASHHALRILTFGGQNRYLSHYVTTLGHTIYVPDDWPEWDPAHAWEVLRHELVHVAQFERFGWFGMLLIYGFFPLPAGLAYGRARLEWEAYRETLRATAELEGMDAARDPALHAQIVERFTGPDYGWMWPFPRQVQRWIDEALPGIEAEIAAASDEAG